jgi:hypothetical protein
VRDFVSNLRAATTARRSFGVHEALIRLCIRCLVLLLLIVGLMSESSAAAPANDSFPESLVSRSPGASFAIADLDGDQLPDLASIEIGQIGASSTDYWIRLQLTGSEWQAIQVIAPPGGLLIEARDVNGDNAIDLVLATAWLKQPVAVFLNDGHGRFSRAEPSDFPNAFSHPVGSWDSSSSPQSAEILGVPPQPRSGICSEATRLADGQCASGSTLTSRFEFFLGSFRIVFSGRAPPLESHSL